MARIVQKALKNEKDNGGDDEVEGECWRPIVILRLGFEYVKDFAEDGEMVLFLKKFLVLRRCFLYHFIICIP